MKKEQFEILYALNTFAQMRAAWIDDAINKTPDLYIGLHCLENALSEIYLDHCKVRWMLEHFETYIEIINKKIPDIEKRCRVDCVRYFSQLLRDFVRSFGETADVSDFLSAYDIQLSELIFTAENWEKKYNELCVQKLKCNEKINKLKKQILEV